MYQLAIRIHSCSVRHTEQPLQRTNTMTSTLLLPVCVDMCVTRLGHLQDRIGKTILLTCRMCKTKWSKSCEGHHDSRAFGTSGTSGAFGASGASTCHSHGSKPTTWRNQRKKKTPVSIDRRPPSTECVYFSALLPTHIGAHISQLISCACMYQQSRGKILFGAENGLHFHSCPW